MFPSKGGGVSRCSSCDLNYPRGRDFEVCLVCMKPTWIAFDEKVTDNWRELVRDAVDVPENSLLRLIRMSPHKPDAKALVLPYKGRDWIKHGELLDAGYSSLEADSIVFVNGAFYELQAYDRSSKSWWVVEIPVEGASEDLTPEKVIQGAG